MSDFFNVMNLKVVIKTFRLQHLSDISMLSNFSGSKRSNFMLANFFDLKSEMIKNFKN